jgi:preprotein translocase subunit SecE
MAEAKEKLGFFARAGKYFRDFKGEMKKISWPTRQQVVHNTLIVIAAIVLCGIVIWGLDWVFGQLIQLVLNLK